MKRNDIGDSYVVGCSTGSLRRGECIQAKRRSRRPMLASTPHYRHRSARLDALKSYAGTPTIGNAGSLWFPFHSPGATEAGQCGVERRPPVQERSELQAHDAMVLQCPAVEVREGLGRSPGPCHTSSASFLGTPHRFATVAVRYARGAAFDL